MTDDIAGDGNDRYEPHLVAFDNWHAPKVEITPADGECLADSHAGAEHEGGDDVGEVSPAGARLGSRLLRVFGGALHQARNFRRSSRDKAWVFWSRLRSGPGVGLDCPGLPRAARQP